jgi:hypothetical protein
MLASVRLCASGTPGRFEYGAWQALAINHPHGELLRHFLSSRLFDMMRKRDFPQQRRGGHRERVDRFARHRSGYRSASRARRIG